MGISSYFPTIASFWPKNVRKLQNEAKIGNANYNKYKFDFVKEQFNKLIHQSPVLPMSMFVAADAALMYAHSTIWDPLSMGTVVGGGAGALAIAAFSGLRGKKISMNPDQAGEEIVKLTTFLALMTLAIGFTPYVGSYDCANAFISGTGLLTGGLITGELAYRLKKQLVNAKSEYDQGVELRKKERDARISRLGEAKNKEVFSRLLVSASDMLISGLAIGIHSNMMNYYSTGTVLGTLAGSATIMGANALFGKKITSRPMENYIAYPAMVGLSALILNWGISPDVAHAYIAGNLISTGMLAGYEAGVASYQVGVKELPKMRKWCAKHYFMTGAAISVASSALVYGAVNYMSTSSVITAASSSALAAAGIFGFGRKKQS